MRFGASNFRSCLLWAFWLRSVSSPEIDRDIYIGKRLEIAARKPFNLDSLFTALQMLWLNQSLDLMQAELLVEVRLGNSLLGITLKEITYGILLNTCNNPLNLSLGCNFNASDRFLGYLDRHIPLVAIQVDRNKLKKQYLPNN